MSGLIHTKIVKHKKSNRKFKLNHKILARYLCEKKNHTHTQITSIKTRLATFETVYIDISI